MSIELHQAKNAAENESENHSEILVERSNWPPDTSGCHSYANCSLLLQNAWLNEKFCPRLLPPATEVLDCLTEQLAQLENNLVQVSKTDFRVPLHKMEVARIR